MRYLALILLSLLLAACSNLNTRINVLKNITPSDVATLHALLKDKPYLIKSSSSEWKNIPEIIAKEVPRIILVSQNHIEVSWDERGKYAALGIDWSNDVKNAKSEIIEGIEKSRAENMDVDFNESNIVIIQESDPCIVYYEFEINVGVSLLNEIIDTAEK